VPSAADPTVFHTIDGRRTDLLDLIESIRGEGAETRFAEVTFTHQTWAKINSEMDTRFSTLSIVGWYHTHPDFGIFLSDRDRFIQEHFFCGPGQVAHVIDPIRKIEGVFDWRDAKPVLTRHFWVGARVVVGTSGAADGEIGSSTESRSLMPTKAIGSSASGTPSRARVPGSSSPVRARIPPSARLILYGGVFLLGYPVLKLSLGFYARAMLASLGSSG
jgi:hypothetical protein